jgi:AraC family transcriptional regulator of adaptative response/methylated-DNA-[protein]-cysteine methyltransferase
MNTIQYYATPAGSLELTIQNNRLIKAIFVDEPINAEFITTPPPLLLDGTPFQLKVWQEAQNIPSGIAITYKDLARKIGHPASWRAVANALANNKISYFIPCHRIINSAGKLAGYRWGIHRKKILLEAERLEE